MNIFKIFSLSILSFLFFGQTIENNPEKHLFKIIENDRVGYIDSAGNVIIKPIFRAGDNFSEGLASVRLNGTYGFIDKTGEFVIPPQYDYAESFWDSIALVYKNGIPLYINHKGEKLFENSFPVLGYLGNNRFGVETYTEKYGYLDLNGRLVIDTIYSYISPFNEGLAVVKGLNHRAYCDEEKGKNLEFGIIDTNGRFILPFGICKKIKNYSEGYYVAEFDVNCSQEENHISSYGMIDGKGNILFRKEMKSFSRISGDVHNGLAVIHINELYYVENKEFERRYEGFINTSGDIVLKDTNIRFAEDFSKGLAYIRSYDFLDKIIDTKMNIVLDSVHYNGNLTLKNGLLPVKKKKWGLIDTNGRFVLQPTFGKIYPYGFDGKCIFFEEVVQLDEYTNINLTGIAGIDGKVILEPSIRDFNGGWFHNGLYEVYSNSKLRYINTSGVTIWEEKSFPTDSLRTLNIDYMLESNFRAGSKPYKSDRGGFDNSGNMPKDITESDNFPSYMLSLNVHPEILDTFKIIEHKNNSEFTISKYSGIIVYLSNRRSSEVLFSAMNGYLQMQMQAKDINGNWEDINLIYLTDVMNSYHTLTLEPNKYWSFTAPLFEGDFHTKLRIKVEYIDPDEKNSELRYKILYSNEFDGTINPGQLWRNPICGGCLKRSVYCPY